MTAFCSESGKYVAYIAIIYRFLLVQTRLVMIYYGWQVTSYCYGFSILVENAKSHWCFSQMSLLVEPSHLVMKFHFSSNGYYRWKITPTPPTPTMLTSLRNSMWVLDLCSREKGSF